MPSSISKNLKTSKITSFIIPTLNSAKVLDDCLSSIVKQSNQSFEILIIDANSSDNTLKIAKKYNCKFFKNPLVTAESAKAIGLKEARGYYIAFVDSDNILPSKYWLSKMLTPFHDPQIIASEPIKFTYRKNSGYIERYSALIGANDPYAFFCGNYDRQSVLTGTWTSLKLKTQKFKKYLKVKIDDNRYIPTIGANGTIFRKDFLEKHFQGQYLYDIDLLVSAPKPLFVSKVYTGIIHTFCESSILKFIRKQNRRVVDYYYFQSRRQYQWQANNKSNAIPFTLYSLLIVPTLIDAIRGYLKKPDIAWFFHPLACYLTWWIYATVTLKQFFKIQKKLDRKQWRQ
ncbi:glycosyltransferase [Patescibacteria group bacterium]|nr:glycosyltransferase [Patescibacteria group bacterium]